MDTRELSNRARLGRRAIAVAAGAALSLVLSAVPASAQEKLVTGKSITPFGTHQNVGSLPMNLVLSPNGKYAVSTDMGFREALWSLDVSTGKGVSHITYGDPNAPTTDTNGLYYGLAFTSDGTLYAAQGENQTIAVLSLSSSGTLTQTRTIATKPKDFPSGLATDTKGHLYVANNDPDTFAQPTSVAIYDALSGTELGRYVFSDSFGATPNFPLAVAALADGSKVYVGSQRDSAVYVIDTTDPHNPKLANKIMTGKHPIGLLLNKDQTKLFVANAHSDTVSLVDTRTDAVRSTLLVRPQRLAKVAGATPDNLALSPDEKTLYVTLGDMNAVAFVQVTGFDLDFLGYLPTGWYPTGVVASPDGKRLLVSSAKGVINKYPDPGYKQFTFNADPQYDLNQIEGTVTTIELPNIYQLHKYTALTLVNNGLPASVDDADASGDKNHDPEPQVANKNAPAPASGDNGYPIDHRLDSLGLKAGKIKHVIYIVKENRTYDQVLGDLPQGNGDAKLAMFGKAVTPNLHAIASRFVLLDNFYDCGEASGDGWPWSTQSMANEYVIKNLPYNYSGRGRNYDFEGQNNGYPAGGFPATDPDGKILSDVFPKGAPPIPDVAEAPGGHIWDLAHDAGLTYRDYGFFYTFGVATKGPGGVTTTVIPDNYPAAKNLQPAGHDLAGHSDFDFRRYDNTYADSDGPRSYGVPETVQTYGKHNAHSRFEEWNTEFQEMLAKDHGGAAVPALMFVRFHHDHTQGMAPGAFAPEAEVADNDYAVGQLVQAVSKSPIWDSTAVFIIEDDAQDGPDHVDVHRSTCYVISPYIKQGTVDHTFYNTDSVLKTIEMLLGLHPMSQYDAIANPLLVFGNAPSNNAAFTATPAAREIMTKKNPTATALKADDWRLPLVKASEKMDFLHPDSAPARQLNQILWQAVKGPDAKFPELHNSTETALSFKKAADRKDDDD